MDLNDITYEALIGMGFSRHELEDEVCFRRTGYKGFSLSVEFPHLEVGISTPCFAACEKGTWAFGLFNTNSGNIIRIVEKRELRSLVRHLRAEDKQIANLLSEIQTLTAI